MDVSVVNSGLLPPKTSYPTYLVLPFGINLSFFSSYSQYYKRDILDFLTSFIYLEFYS